VAALDGKSIAQGRLAAVARDDAEAADIGTALAERLLQEGAAEILAEVRALGGHASA
jgi:porphobilinogen deaminase